MLMNTEPTHSFWQRRIVRWVVALVSVFVFAVVLQMLYGAARVAFVSYIDRTYVEPLVMAGDIPGQTEWILLKQKIVAYAHAFLLIPGLLFAWFIATKWLGYRRWSVVFALVVLLLLFGIVVPYIAMPFVVGSGIGCVIIPSEIPGTPTPTGCYPTSWTMWLVR